MDVLPTVDWITTNENVHRLARSWDFLDVIQAHRPNRGGICLACDQIWPCDMRKVAEQAAELRAGQQWTIL